MKRREFITLAAGAAAAPVPANLAARKATSTIPQGGYTATRLADGKSTELCITKSAGKKIRPLSDSRPPVRPPGEPTQTEFMMANDLR
jgi:hypothetical protein